MPTLVLLRHAKAEPHRADDHSRQLAARGRADAADVRTWLRSERIVPTHAIVSTSARTRETWELADPGSTETSYDGRAYEASVADLREVLADATGDCVVLVGHNPSIERLAWELDDSADARERTDQGMRTCAVAVFSVDDWRLDGARLTAYRG